MRYKRWAMKAVTAAGVLCAGLLSADVQAGDTSVTEMPVKEYSLSVRSADEEAVFPRGVSVQGQNLEGMTLEEARAWVEEYVRVRQTRSITLTVYTDNTFCYDGSSFGTEWNNPELLDELSSCVSGGNFVEQYKKQKDLDASPVNLEISLSIDETAVRNVVQELSDNFYIAPVNASVRREGGGFIVSQEIVGKEFDPDAITVELTTLITDFSNTDAIVYDLPYKELPAQYTSEDFNFSAVPLGSYSTGNLGSAERTHNIRLSAEGEEGKNIGINGRIVYPGEEVSALEMYGAQTTENGYLPAPGYEQGKQVTAIGGGVCQTTTTLYNALLLAEITITQRSAHSMLVTYVPPALDAAVASGSKDLKFRNDLSHPIYLEAYVADGQLTINIWGVEERPANRKVTYEYTVEMCNFPSPLYQDVVDDIGCTYGSDVYVGSKLSAPVETHPEVKARSYKVVWIDGVETERTQLNYDYYEPMVGELHHASDCTVYSEPRQSSAGDAVYRYLGWTIYHEVRRQDGSDW